MNTDPRGPVRKIKSIEETPSATLLTLDCGHTGSHAAHFSYRVGDDIHCFQCGQAAPQKLMLVDWRVGDQYACIGNGLFVRTRARKNRRG